MPPATVGWVSDEKACVSFGRKFQGPAETINLDALTARINSNSAQQYGHLERQWEKLLVSDQPPRIRVKQWIEYPGTSRRPDTLSIEYTVHHPDGSVDGPYEQEFYND